ncbi:MAG: Holliday junction resolvase RuvX [Candidatus Hydrogenedentes bacterium]|nr:Holliday junction resolvase RuvX [Candidatus Hydrogenedentota bacterium]
MFTLPEYGRVVGLDVGEVRTGVAVSDPMRMIASPHDTIAMGSPEANIEAVRRVVAATEAVCLVAGVPLDREGKPGPQAQKVLAFVEQLRAALDIPVETVDERFSTAGAERALRAADVRGRKRRGVIDKVAAADILRTFLDRLAAQAAAARRNHEP